ncbi:glycosyltransferase family 2 protein [Acinetobacter nectaris]|uniref:glycosyltransferase family 2 protein n=2 Tax=Acinetobacter nectaris TaxID=1219382 RepID=UPI001F4794EC|nr:glycosyltransferase family 2 protein [Acinetobacter nectaris]MCF9027061.1 glycosyltransferase family 2 protein [Acinetobacter nectaris]
MYIISLIIPIYKVEKYIESCLHSVFNQSCNENIEVILVDDGSPDNSISIAQSYIDSLSLVHKKNTRIIQQENKGLSGARNTGIKHAQGKYLAFLDSDDILNANFFSKIIPILDNIEPEILQFRAERFDDQGNVTSFLSSLAVDGLYTKDEIWQSLCNQSAWFAWLRVYNRKLFVNENFFPEGKNFEDAYTIPYIFLSAKKIFILNDILIKYRFNPLGITATKSEKNLTDLGDSVYKMASKLDIDSVLTASVISLSQSYIDDSLKSEGRPKAKQRWTVLKKHLLSADGFTPSMITNRGNKLFYIFGISFLVFVNKLKKIGIKK